MKVYEIRINGKIFETCDGITETSERLKSIMTNYIDFCFYVKQQFDIVVKSVEIIETDEYVSTSCGHISHNDLYNN